MIRIITDSASDFELSEAEKLNVTVLPMQIQFGNTSFLDRYEISADTFYQKLIERLRSPHDKRYILIQLTALGQTQYQQEHIHILGIMEQLILQLGPDETTHLIPELSHIAAIMKKLKEE